MHVKLSLRSSDPREVKARTARLEAHLEEVWARLREDRPTTLTHKQAVALAGELYRDWAGGEGRERTLSVTLDRVTRKPIPDAPDESADIGPAHWAASRESLQRLKLQDEEYREGGASGRRPFEVAFGGIVDALLSRRAITRLDPVSREVVLEAFRQALIDAFAARERNASGDYAPDLKAARFPPVQESFADARPEPSTARPKVSLKSLFEDWQTEAKAAGRAESTFDSYSRTFRLFGEFLRHDDASRVSPDDVQRFKDHRREQGVSIKTVRDSDITALKSVFGWAVGNGRLKLNPAANVKMMVAKTPEVRERAFTDDEAKAILRHASAYRPTSARESSKVAAAKRWIPWLCAYSGARVGEIAQLRKDDVALVGNYRAFTITPEAGTVKDKKKRQVIIHEHLIELGFLDFVKSSAPGYLFLNAKPDDDATSIRGLWRSVKNRLTDFVREVVTDKGVAPNHGWRHTFKMIGGEADMKEKVLDAICGHAHKTEGRKYGPVKLAEQAHELAKFPRYDLEGAGRD